MGERPSSVPGRGSVSPSLARRILLTNFGMILLVAAMAAVVAYQPLMQLAAAGLKRVHPPEHPSARAAEGMLSAISAYEAGDIGRAEAERQFQNWLEAERQGETTDGERKLAGAIAGDGEQFFRTTHKSKRLAASSGKRLESDLKQLIALKPRIVVAGENRLPIGEIAASLPMEPLGLAALAILMALVSGFSMTGKMLRRPLRQMAESLKTIDGAGSAHAITPPRVSEFAELAGEFNAMIQRVMSGSTDKVQDIMRERARAFGVINGFDDGVIALDVEDRVVYINEVARVMLDLDAEGLIGAYFDRLAHKSEQVERLLKSGSKPQDAAEFKLSIRGCDHIYLSRKAPWTAPTGEQLGSLFVLRDVTEEREKEKALSAALAAAKPQSTTTVQSTAESRDAASAADTASHVTAAAAQAADPSKPPSPKPREALRPVSHAGKQSAAPVTGPKPAKTPSRPAATAPAPPRTSTTTIRTVPTAKNVGERTRPAQLRPESETPQSKPKPLPEPPPEVPSIAAKPAASTKPAPAPEPARADERPQVPEPPIAAEPEQAIEPVRSIETTVEPPRSQPPVFEPEPVGDAMGAEVLGGDLRAEEAASEETPPEMSNEPPAEPEANFNAANGHAEPIMLDRALREICAPLKTEAEEKGIELIVVGDDRPISISGDPDKLPWVINSVVGEALNHTPADGRVTVALEYDQARKAARIVVTDSGSAIGFDADPSADSDANDSESFELAIARQIVEAHRGTIIAKGHRGAGASLVVELPVFEKAFA
jgi:signal transduction histidine kinase